MRKMRFRRLLATVVVTGALGLLFSATALAQAAETATRATAGVSSASEGADPGVLVVGVEAASPAAAAGLARGDIVLAANGEPVNQAQALRDAVRALAPGATITLTVQHGDDVRDLAVTIGERAQQAFLGIVPYVAHPTGFEAAIRVPAPKAVPFEPFAADIITNVITSHIITDAVMGAVTKMFTVTDMTRAGGLSVVEVMADSPAADAGLQAGDVIAAINQVPLSPALDLTALIAGFRPGAQITLAVQRNGVEANSLELTVTLGDHPDQAGAAYLGVRVAPQMLFFRRPLAGGLAAVRLPDVTRILGRPTGRI